MKSFTFLIKVILESGDIICYMKSLTPSSPIFNHLKTIKSDGSSPFLPKSLWETSQSRRQRKLTKFRACPENFLRLSQKLLVNLYLSRAAARWEFHFMNVRKGRKDRILPLVPYVGGGESGENDGKDSFGYMIADVTSSGGPLLPMRPILTSCVIKVITAQRTLPFLNTLVTCI